jgi:hypothetical protein
MAVGRPRIQGSLSQGIAYPSPFFDLAHTYLPTSLKGLLRWCRYYFLTNPLINAAVFKLSEYPITDIVVEHDSPPVQTRWTEYIQDHLRYRAFQIECGLDYHAYGNAMISVGFPFRKYLACTRCDLRETARSLRPHWRYTSDAFRLTCPRCGHTGDARATDVYLKNPSGIRLIRWNPEDVDITYHDVTGEYAYYYAIPGPLRNDVVVGRKPVVEALPQVFLQAIKEQKGILFSKDNFFHLRRPTLANQDRGWGIPLLLPVLKDAFYLTVLKKAQEAVMAEHVVPLRVLFPQPGTGSSDPYTSINLLDWRDHVATELARWKLDPNYIPILPLPIGHQTIGGDGRALLLTPEIQALSEQILVGLGVPREFVFGGMSYAGTNVSMRMLENAFLGYILSHKQLLRFVMRQVAAFLEWPDATFRFKPFKMADDLQRKAFDFQLNQAGKISDTTLLATSDYVHSDETALMLRETDSRLEALKKQQVATAEIQGEAQLVLSKFQVKAQQAQLEAQAAPLAPGEPGAGAAPPELDALGSSLSLGQRMDGQLQIDLPSLAMQQAQMLASMPRDAQAMALENLRIQSPELASLVAQALREQASGTDDATAVDLRPLPSKLPPRRQQAMV